MRRLKFYLFFSWLLLLFAYGAVRYPVPMHSGLKILKSLAWLLILLGAMLALGRDLLLRFGVFMGSLCEEACFSLGLGALALSSIFFVFGYFGAAYDWVAWISLGACWLAGFGNVEHFFTELRHSLRSKHPWEGSSTEMLTVLACALSLLVVLALCLAPVTFYDALVYHLALPQRAAALGIGRPMEGNLYSWLPGGAESLWTLCLLLDSGGETPRLAALLNFSFCVATALAVMDAGARFVPRARLWLPAALFLTQPLAVLSFGVFSADGIACFFTFLSLYAFLNTLSERNQSLRGGWLMLAALLAGFGVAVKPVALIHATVLLMLTGVRALREPDERRPGLLLACAGLFILPLLPWLLRNFLLNGNPVYPFGFALLGLKPASTIYLEHVAGFGSGIAAWRLPWAATFESAQFGGDGNLSFIFLALLPAAFFVRFSRELRWLSAYLVASFLLWAMGPRVLRYALPALPGLCLFAAYCLSEIEEWAVSRSWGLALRMTVVATLFLGAGQTLCIAAKDFSPFQVALGLESEQDYLSRRDVNTARAAEWLKEHSAWDRGLVLLGDSRTAYLPPQILASTVFEAHPFKAWLDASATPQDLDASLAQKGYDFVLVNRREWSRIQESPGAHYDYFSSPPKEALFMDWLNAHLADKAQVYDSEGLLVFPVQPNPKLKAS